MYFFMLAATAFLTGMIVNSVLRKSINELLEEADCIDNSKNSFIKQLKLRYDNNIRLGHEISNTQAFAEKYLNKYKCHGIVFSTYERISVISAGMCVIFGIGGALFEKEHALEYLLIGFLAMYVISGMRHIIDVQGKLKKITVDIVDYFENRYCAVTREKPCEEEVAITRMEQEIPPVSLSVEERKLIDEILKEYLG